MSTAFISVIMPVYNRAEFIGEAIQSILSQTYKNFELIIIDDASTDNTLKVISEFTDDDRILLLKNKKNEGVAATRNRGIEIAKGEFIAFMDSDDISLPQRFEKQVKILCSHKEVIVCGSWLRFLESQKLIKHKEYHNEIISRLLLHCSLSLGTVMIKSFILRKAKLNPNLKFGEDYEFWSRICWMGEMYNIPKPLLLYRTHRNQLSGRHKQQQLKMDVDIRLSLFKKLNYPVSKFPDDLLKKVILFDEYISIPEFSKFLSWLENLKKKNRVQMVFPPEEFDKVIEEIRENLLFKIYFKENKIGLRKIWRMKSLVCLKKHEAFRILVKKIKIGKA